VSRLVRLALVVLAVSSALVGLWAQAFPRSFYDDFPGLGRVWVAVDGPFNEHLVRDVGGLNLGLAFVAALALITANPVAARAAGGAALIYGVPHLTYHALNTEGFATTDVAAMLVSLGLGILAGAAALGGGAGAEAPAGAPASE